MLDLLWRNLKIFITQRVQGILDVVWKKVKFKKNKYLFEEFCQIPFYIFIRVSLKNSAKFISTFLAS